MRTLIRPAIVSFALLTLVTGVVYPAIVTGIARVTFAGPAGGGIIERDGKAVGSALIAQPFTADKYFWPRPSAASYDGSASSGSNLGPTNPALAGAVAVRVAALRSSGADAAAPVPVDLVTASASGLDPHISVEAAAFQVARVAKARSLSEARVSELIRSSTELPAFGVFGERRVNVLRLNLSLDRPEEPR